MLYFAGIQSEDQLRTMGTVAAYLTVTKAGYSPSMKLLWAIEGALTNRDWKEVSRKERTSLLFQLDYYEQGEK